MGLFSPGGENLLDFLELRHVLSTYDGDLRDPTGGFKKGQSPCELLGGLSGATWVPLPSMLGPKTLCGVSAGTCRFLSSADMDLGVLLEAPQGSQSSSQVGACTCAFLQSGSSSVAIPFAWIKG